MVEQRQQRRRRFTAQGFGEFEIAPRGRVHAHPLARLFNGECAQVRNRRALRGFYIVEQRVGRTHRDRHLFRAKTGQIVRAELLTEIAPRRIEIEAPWRHAFDRNLQCFRQLLLQPFWRENFGGT